MTHGRRHFWRYLTIAAISFLLITGAWYFMKPVQQSKQLEHQLVEKYGWAPLYTAPADGVIQPDRIERFIRVREAVQANCATFQKIMDDVIGLEKLESDPDLSAAEKTSEGFETFVSMLSAAPAFLEFMDARNSALLAEEMGLGEYIYIYLAAYGEQIALETEGPYAGQEEAYLSPRARKEYIRMLGNQLAALQASDQHRDAVVLELEAILKTEMAALEDNPDHSPWPAGPPARTGESLAPYRDQISALYCPGIVRVEILQKNKGFNFEG